MADSKEIVGALIATLKEKFGDDLGKEVIGSMIQRIREAVEAGLKGAAKK